MNKYFPVNKGVFINVIYEKDCFDGFDNVRNKFFNNSAFDIRKMNGCKGEPVRAMKDKVFFSRNSEAKCNHFST